MTWTLCTSGAAIAKAGVYANATIITSGSWLATWSDEAEALASSICRVELSGGYAGYTTTGKQIISDLVSSYIAQHIVAYDMSGYTSRGEAVQILNMLENNIQRNTKMLTDDKYKTYLGVTS